MVFGFDAAMARQNKRGVVVWDTDRLINAHALIVGKSGTGKTFTFRRCIHQLQKQARNGLRVHVFDSHGDIEIEGASTVKFSEATQYGFNPLAINADPDFGGVRKRIQYFISALNRTSRKLGTKQESTLRNILYDLYSANGFYDGKPDSWRMDDGVSRRFAKKQPTMEDACKFAQFKLKGMVLGAPSKPLAALESLNKHMMGLQKKLKQAVKAGHALDEREKLEAELEKMKKEAVSLFHDYVSSIQTGTELNDLIRYDSRDVLKSVVERLENLNAIGIFKNTPPPFEEGKMVWRYDIKSLSADEKKLFVAFVIENIFAKTVQRGIATDLRELIILDEAHLFLNEDPENILNIVAKEARKFGGGLFCASQSPTHFSDDFISNVGTKIILGLDQMFWDGSCRKLKIDMATLEWIVPHQNMVVQMNNRGETRNTFIWTELKDPFPKGKEEG